MENSPRNPHGLLHEIIISANIVRDSNIHECEYIRRFRKGFSRV